MINIDVDFERIDNGFIVTGNDSTKNKRYFRTIEEFVNSEILEAVKENDKMIKEHSYPHGLKFNFKAEVITA